MPQLVTVRFRRRRDGGWVRLWVPLLPIAMVFSPLLVLAVVAAFFVCRIYRIDTVRMLSVGWQLMCALGGTRIEFERGRTALLLHVR